MGTLIYKLILLYLFAYFIGSIPFAFIIGKLKGKDLRKYGSGNVGATNAGRVLGKKYFYISLTLDALKGFIPTIAAKFTLFSTTTLPLDKSHLLWVLTGFFAIAGHNWPIWLRFKGGKGVATSLGVVLAIYPYYTIPAIIALITWIAMVIVTGYVSVGSISSAIIFITSFFVFVYLFPTWTLNELWPLAIIGSVLVVVLIYRHRSNISRLIAGTENKFTLK